MKYQLASLGVFVLAFLFHGLFPIVDHNPTPHAELQQLQTRGITHRFLSPDLIELHEEWSGRTWVKTLREPGEAEIRSWAAQRGIPILEIDPNTIDTSQYTGWYTYWTEVPLSNSTIPLVVADLNRNGRTEVYGSFKSFNSDIEARVYDVDSNGVVSFLHVYTPRPGVARQVADADQDSLWEVTFTLGGVLSVYEQMIPTHIANVLSFQHQRYQSPTSPGSTGIHVGFLDHDSLSDFLYKGSEQDTTGFGQTKIYVAEFDADSNNFVRVWSTTYVTGAQSGISGFSVADFDGDGLMEFVVSHYDGRVFVTENTGDNEYAITWQDSIPFQNVYYHGSGDVDSDGKPEFYVGATISSGNWTVMFETDSNDSYSPKLIFHLISGGTFDEPTYHVADLDGDRGQELVVFSGSYLYVFKGDGDNSYRLWYLRQEGRQSIQLYDFNNDGKKDLVISKREVNALGQSRFYASIYLASDLVGISEEEPPTGFMLYQNYPNPFNPATHIEFHLPYEEPVKLVIFDLLGSEVEILVNGLTNPGKHQVTWNTSGRSSGVYFCRLQTPSYGATRKLLLIR